MPCLHLCRSEVQGARMCCPSLSGLEGQILHGKPQAPCPPLLRSRCSRRGYCWQASQAQQLHLHPFCSSRQTTSKTSKSSPHQCRGSVCDSTNVTYSGTYQAYHNTSAHLVKWVTENNRPANIINDRELRELLVAGRPNMVLPSNTTISRDIKASFEKCRERVAKLLQEHPGRLHFATDAWTSPNHRAFIAWTVHLEYEGEMLSFLIDISELPEVRLAMF